MIHKRLPVLDRPASRCLMGASFGGVATLSTAVRYPGYFGRLLLQSGSFAFTDIGQNRRGPAFNPVVEWMNAFRANPSAVSERTSKPMLESAESDFRALWPRVEDEAKAEEKRLVEAFENPKAAALARAAE